MDPKDMEISELKIKLNILVSGLKVIEAVAGNLPDSRVEAVGGVNDGVSRANMVVAAREIASNALELAGYEPTRF